MVSVGVVDEPDQTVANLAQVVRRNLGGHADRDAVGAVDQQIGKLARQNQRFAIFAIVIVDKIDRVAFQVFEHFRRRWPTGGLRCTA